MSSTKLPRTWVPYIVLGGSLLLTALSSGYVSLTARARDQLRFENAVQRAQGDLENRLDTYIELLRSGSGLFAANSQVSRSQFRAFIDRLELAQRYPGVQGIGYSIRVQPNQVNSLVANLRKQGLSNFSIRPTTPRSEYHAIIYLEPLDRRNQAAIGYDMFTEATRRSAMEKARDTGLPAASGRVTLVQEIDQRKQAGFLIYLPIYRNGRIPTSNSERRASLQGFIYSPFRADDLFAGIFSNEEQLTVDVEVYVGSEIRPEHRLHDSKQFNPRNATHQPNFSKTRTINVAGRRWTLLFTARPELALDSQSGRVPFLFAGGVLLSLVLFGITRSLARARDAAEKAAADLRQSETRFRTLIEQSPLSTQIFSPSGWTVRVNRAWEELWGVKLDAIGGYNILQDEQLVTKGVMTAVYRAFGGEAAVIPPFVYDPQLSFPHQVSHDDSPRWIQAYIYPVKDERNQIREVVIVHEDITERKLAEAALQERNERLALLYDMSSSLLLHEQPKAFINSLFSQLSNHLQLEVYLNYLLQHDPQKLRLNAYSGISETAAATIAEIDVGESVCGSVALEKRSIVAEEVQQSSDPRWELIRSAGITAYSCHPLIAGGHLIGTLAFGTRNRQCFTPDELALMQVVCDQVATAIERAQLLEELKRQTEELQQANRTKDEFLATLSHELRTPLTAMVGWITLLRSRPYNEATAARGLETIDRNTQSLAQLIEDVLDVSRMITGKLTLTRIEVGLLPILEAAIEKIRPAAAEKKIRLECHFEPLFGMISADITRLQQVFWNLLSNAVKFTPQGGQVMVHLKQVGSFAQVQVSDTGLGIASEFLPHVFDRFRQADSSMTRQHGGLGLGLAIVQHLVKLHDGTIQVESSGEGQGTTFTVCLPLRTVLSQSTVSH